MRPSVIRAVMVACLLAAVSVVWATAVNAAPAPSPATAAVQTEKPHVGEANLVLPDLRTVSFLGIDGHTLLSAGLIV